MQKVTPYTGHFYLIWRTKKNHKTLRDFSYNILGFKNLIYEATNTHKKYHKNSNEPQNLIFAKVNLIKRPTKSHMMVLDCSENVIHIVCIYIDVTCLI